MKESITVTGIVLGIFLIALGLILSLVYGWTMLACNTWGRESDRTYKFIGSFPLYADCLVLTENGWISASHLFQGEISDLK
mgnify:FL=1